LNDTFDAGNCGARNEMALRFDIRLLTNSKEANSSTQ
jgi:hypothetical protein